MDLQQQFLTLMAALGVDNDTAQQHLLALLNYYNAPQRHYHNLSHIRALLSYFEQIKNKLNLPNAVLLAIFYHDIIYNPIHLDNEAKSANLLTHDFDGVIDSQILEFAENLIVMMTHHRLDNTLIKPLQQDAKFFLDMDLAILGSKPNIYQAYAQAIRQEYAHVPETMYKKGRAEVLTNFLQRPKLFFSEPFFLKFESIARDNLNTEIKLLTTDYKE